MAHLVPNIHGRQGTLIRIEDKVISRLRFNGPYDQSGRQVGFFNCGVSQIIWVVGTGELAQRSSWCQTWNVHMFARPEVRFH